MLACGGAFNRINVQAVTGVPTFWVGTKQMVCQSALMELSWSDVCKQNNWLPDECLWIGSDRYSNCFPLSFYVRARRALQFPPEGWLRMSLNNGSITHLVIRPSGRVALRMLGDTGFMPPEKITRT